MTTKILVLADRRNTISRLLRRILAKDSVPDAEEESMDTIQVTSTKDLLWRVGGEEYADEHRGKTYEATVGDDGWATVWYDGGGSGFKLAPGTFHKLPLVPLPKGRTK